MRLTHNKEFKKKDGDNTARMVRIKPRQRDICTFQWISGRSRAHKHKKNIERGVFEYCDFLERKINRGDIATLEECAVVRETGGSQINITQDFSLLSNLYTLTLLYGVSLLFFSSCFPTISY